MTEIIETSKTGQQLMAAIAPEAAKIEQTMKQDLQAALVGADPLLVEIIEYGIFNGGKRIRPLLVVLASRLCGSQGNGVYQLAIAFEYLHAATLFHDDVIDHADTRRGKPSVNKQFGEIGAILAGDYLHAHSMALVGTRGGIRELEIFTAATTSMVDGEFLQLRNSTDFDLSEENYFAVVKGKTAHLLAATCEIGACKAGGNEQQQKALRTYGLKLGCAFQIVDDLLDYLGDEQKTGKAVGNDFVEGKMTLPLIMAMENADAGGRQEMLTVLSSQEKRQAGFDAGRRFIDRWNGFELTRGRAEMMVAEAVAELQIFTAPEALPIVALLDALAQYVLQRKK